MSRTFFLVLFLSAGCATVEAESPKSAANGFLPKATSGLAEFQTAWDKVKSFRADYTQSVRSKLIPGEPDKTSGKVALVKPDKLRWECETDKSLHLLKGTQLTTVRKNSRGTTEVEIYSKVNTANARAMSLLTGKTALAKLYKPKVLKSDKNSVQLELAEKKKGGEVYVLTISLPDQGLKSIQTESEDSDVLLEFTNPVLNPKIAESEFQYATTGDDVVTKH